MLDRGATRRSDKTLANDCRSSRPGADAGSLGKASNGLRPSSGSAPRIVMAR